MKRPVTLGLILSAFTLPGTAPLAQAQLPVSIYKQSDAEAMQAGNAAYLAGKYADAARWFKTAADSGSAEGAARLAEMYWLGDGVERSLTEAARWYEQAAGQGHARAQMALAAFYEGGLGVKQSEAQARYWYQQAAAQGETQALEKLKTWGGDPSPAQATPQTASADRNFDAGYTAFEARNYARAIEIWTDLAERGHGLSAYNLGAIYANGTGVAPSSSHSASWYEKGAELGNLEAQLKIADAYYDGKGVTQSLAMSESWYRKAIAQGSEAGKMGLYYILKKQGHNEKARTLLQDIADRGFAEAQATLGLYYYLGEPDLGIETDYGKAVSLLQRAVEQNHDYSFYWLGKAYAEGHGVEKSPQKAVALWKRGAERGVLSAQASLDDDTLQEVARASTVKLISRAHAGEAAAQYALGNAYRDGYGVQPSTTLAVHWYKKAMAQGDPNAEYAMAWAYMAGEGVPEDMKKGVKLLLRSAKRGDRAGLSHLIQIGGKAYHKDYDWDLSLKIFKPLAEEGHADAQWFLARHYEFGQGLKADKNKARYWYSQSAEQGNPFAMYALGFRAELGGDYKTARHWYEKGIEKNHVSSLAGMASLYGQGLGVKRDNAKAAELYDKAAALGDERAKTHATVARIHHKQDEEAAAEARRAEEARQKREADIKKQKAKEAEAKRQVNRYQVPEKKLRGWTGFLVAMMMGNQGYRAPSYNSGGSSYVAPSYSSSRGSRELTYKEFHNQQWLKSPQNYYQNRYKY